MVSSVKGGVERGWRREFHTSEEICMADMQWIPNALTLGLYVTMDVNVSSV
jgi:hypothetical protein